MEGLLVNQHLGEAAQLWIFGLRDGKADLIERRFTPPVGTGQKRWIDLTVLLKDCRTVLVSGIGTQPLAILEQAGVHVVVMEGFASEGVEAVLTGREIPAVLLRTPARCGIGQQCTGTGTGCG
jgi:nitrogen fixation protein NifB